MDIALSKNLLSYTKKNLEGFVILTDSSRGLAQKIREIFAKN